MSDRMSLRARLVALTTFLLALGLLVAAMAVTGLLRNYLETRVDDQLRPAAEILRRVSSLPLSSAQKTQGGSLPSTVQSIFGSPTVIYLDRDGHVVGTLNETELQARSGPRLPKLDSTTMTSVGNRPMTVPSRDDQERWRLIALPLEDREDLPVGASGSSAATVVVATSMSKVDATIGTLWTISLGVGTALLAVLALVSWFAIRSGFRPLDRIEETAAAIAGGDLSRRVPNLAAPSTEMGQLATALNGMLVQIETAFAARADSEARMRRFVADASHELRTPLVGIKGFTDLYRMGALSGADDIDRTMERIAGESERLASLVEDLLLLANLDERSAGSGLPLHLAPTDLRSLAADALHDVRALDPSRPVSLTGPGGGPPSAAATLADEARLRQVVTNLVGNAITHTPAGTPVRIGVGTADGHAVLEVADQGDGLTRPEAARVFERFYRADSSRTRVAGAGAGLGLAIVQSLVTAHGGHVRLVTAPGEGATFCILLPALPEAAADTRHTAPDATRPTGLPRPPAARPRFDWPQKYSTPIEWPGVRVRSRE